MDQRAKYLGYKGQLIQTLLSGQTHTHTHRTDCSTRTSKVVGECKASRDLSATTELILGDICVPSTAIYLQYRGSGLAPTAIGFFSVAGPTLWNSLSLSRILSGTRRSVSDVYLKVICNDFLPN